MKTNKNIRNLFFIFTSIFIIFCICFFNYKIDPYKLFGNKYYMRLNLYPRDIVYTIMQIYKDQKSDTILIGGSEGLSLFNEYYSIFFNNISMEGINYRQYRELLEAYLELHPETKNVIIVFGYVNIIEKINLPMPKFKNKNLCFKEYQKILFSIDVTYKSIKSLKLDIKYRILDKLNKNYLKNIFIVYFPKHSDYYKININNLKEAERNNFSEINKIINLLEEKKLNYTFIFPPYNAIFMSLIYKQKENQNNINNFKRFLVNAVPSDKKIYDFAFVNKYTSSDISTNKDALYINITHPSFIYGTKIIKVLFNDIEADKSIYFLLNKNNIESVIEKENKLIEDYINNNLKLVKYYQKLALEQNEDNILFIKKLKYESLSDESKKEYEYLIRKINNYKKK